MNKPWMEIRWCVHAAAVLAAVLMLLMGQSRSLADDEVLTEETADAQAQRQPHLVDLLSNFDTNLFDRRGNSWVIRGGRAVISSDDVGRRQESPALTRARSAGIKRLERIESACGLSATQRRRLELAIESDARRFASDIDSVRDRYASRQVNMNDQAGQKEWHAFQQDVQKCRERLRRLFEDGSLFTTVLESTLDDQQLACLHEERNARRSFHWRALVAETLARLDDTLALSEQQHEAIEAMLVAREPPLRTNGEMPALEDSNLRRNLVLMVLAEVDAKKLQATVSERQWRTLGNLTSQGRSMRSWIEQQGVLEPREQ